MGPAAKETSRGREIVTDTELNCIKHQRRYLVLEILHSSRLVFSTSPIFLPLKKQGSYTALSPAFPQPPMARCGSQMVVPPPALSPGHPKARRHRPCRAVGVTEAWLSFSFLPFAHQTTRILILPHQNNFLLSSLVMVRPFKASCVVRKV